MCDSLDLCRVLDLRRGSRPRGPAPISHAPFLYFASSLDEKAVDRRRTTYTSDLTSLFITPRTRVKAFVRRLTGWSMGCAVHTAQYVVGRIVNSMGDAYCGCFPRSVSLYTHDVRDCSHHQSPAMEVQVDPPAPASSAHVGGCCNERSRSVDRLPSEVVPSDSSVGGAGVEWACAHNSSKTRNPGAPRVSGFRRSTGWRDWHTGALTADYHHASPSAGMIVYTTAGSRWNSAMMLWIS